MNAHPWFRRLLERNHGPKTQTGRRPRRTRLWAEQLEPRCVPSLTTLVNFNNTNGANPQGALIEDSSGNLFGTTANGGASDYGTVYEVQAGSGPVTTLASFNDTNGADPLGGLIEDSSGNLFGITGGGEQIFGELSGVTVFEVQQGSGTITTLASFNATNGFPHGGLIEDSSGNLFGTTVTAGAFRDGTVFEVQQGSGTITTLASFNGTNGFEPNGGLIEDSSGDLFGTTDYGGEGFTGEYTGDGTVFEVQAGSGTVTTLASFNGTNGAGPLAGLIEDSGGNLFGTTYNTVFEVQQGSGTITALATFNGANGATPDAALVEDSSGNLFGTTLYGGVGYTGRNTGSGTVFEVKQGSNTITPLANFNGTNGSGPVGVVEDSSGNLFGTTAAGGTFGYGTIFEVPAPGPSIATPTLPNWTVNQPGYSQTITASGGAGPYTFAEAGILPTGLTLNSAGVLSGTPTATGSFHFTVTATDSNSATASQRYAVTINPTVSITTASLANGSVGTAYMQTLTVTGGTGSQTFATTAGALPPGLTLSSGGVLSGMPTAAGSYNFTITATDNVGATGSRSYTVTISPFTQYLVTVEGSSTVQAGSNFLVTVQAADQFGNPVTSYSGPASVTAILSPISGASDFPTAVSINPFGFGLFLANLQTVGAYTITAASGTFTGSAPVTVTPGYPARLAFAAQPVNTPTGVTLPAVTVQVLDQFGNLVTADNTDSVTLSVAGGPGSFTAGSTTTAPVINGVATFSNLTLVQPGSYTLSALVPSQYTGPNSASFTVTPLQVLPSSFTSSPSGFSLQFNAPYLINSLTPVLYGQGFAATAPVPSVTLTQTKDGTGNSVNNPINGSLVLNTATNSITFVATNTTLQTDNRSPLLPDGTYTVIVHGSAATDGFQALNSGGGFLDGLASGTAGSGAYTATFTINAAASGDDVVWVPATADGPGQALNAPGMNQAGGGYPVYLNDTTGDVTNVQLALDYNPALLNVTGVTGKGFAPLGTSTPGQVVLQYSGPALPAGSETPIGFITATVPSGTAANPMPYKAKDLLHLANVSLNAGTIPVATSDALHLVAYVANASGSGSYSSNDATLITRVLLQTDTGFTAYPLVDPVIVADTDGDGFIPADAALQANEAGAGFAAPNLPTPAIPAGVVFQAIANNVDPSLGIQGSGVRGQGSGEVVTVSVNIDDAAPAGSTGLIEGHLALTYDPSVFTVSAADDHLGSVLSAGSGWSVVPTINPVTGQIAIALSSTTPISSTVGGSLVTIDFHQISNGEPGGYGEPGGVSPRSTAIALVGSVNPSGQQVVRTELEDAQGTFTLSPAPTGSFVSDLGVVVLPAAPSSAAQSAVVGTAPLAESQAIDSRMLDLSTVETSSPALPTVAPESSDQGIAASSSSTTDLAIVHVSPATFHAAVVVASSAASTSLGSLTSAPLAGLVFQFGSLPMVSATAAGVSVGQHLADQWFQALARGTASPLDPVQLVGTVRDAFERVLAGQLRVTQAATDDLDSLNWDDVSSDLDCQGVDPATALFGHGGRRDRNRTVHETSTPAVVAPSVSDYAVLNQYFAQAAEDTDQITDNE